MGYYTEISNSQYANRYCDEQRDSASVEDQREQGLPVGPAVPRCIFFAQIFAGRMGQVLRFPRSGS